MRTKQIIYTVNPSDRIDRNQFIQDLKSQEIVPKTMGYVVKHQIFFDRWALKYVNGVLQRLGEREKVSNLDRFYQIIAGSQRHAQVFQRVASDLVRLKNSLYDTIRFVGYYKEVEQDFFLDKERYIERSEYFSQILVAYLKSNDIIMCLNRDGLVYNHDKDYTFLTDYRLLLADMKAHGYVGMIDDRDDYDRLCERIVADTVYSEMSSKEVNYGIRLTVLPGTIFSEMLRSICWENYTKSGYFLADLEVSAFCVKGQDFSGEDVLHRFNVYTPFGIVNNCRGDVPLTIVKKLYIDLNRALYDSRSGIIRSDLGLNEIGRTIMVGQFTSLEWEAYKIYLKNLGLSLSIYYDTTKVFMVVPAVVSEEYIDPFYIYSYDEFKKFEDVVKLLNFMIMYFKYRPFNYYNELRKQLFELIKEFEVLDQFVFVALDMLKISNVDLVISYFEFLNRHHEILETGKYWEYVKSEETILRDDSTATEESGTPDSDDIMFTGLDDMQHDSGMLLEKVEDISSLYKADKTKDILASDKMDKNYLVISNYLLILKLLKMMRYDFGHFKYKHITPEYRYLFNRDKDCLNGVMRSIKDETFKTGRIMYDYDILDMDTVYTVEDWTLERRDNSLEYLVSKLRSGAGVSIRIFKIKRKRIHPGEPGVLIGVPFGCFNKVWYVIGFGRTLSTIVRSGIYWYLNKSWLFDHNSKCYGYDPGLIING